MRHVFKNRWLALVWALGVLWMALDFASPGERDAVGNRVTTDVTGAEVSNDQVKEVESIITDL